MGRLYSCTGPQSLAIRARATSSGGISTNLALFEFLNLNGFVYYLILFPFLILSTLDLSPINVPSTSILSNINFFRQSNTENRFYACAAYNAELKEYKFSNQFNFKIQKNKRDRLNSVIPAAEQYVNQSSPIALVGQVHKLHCFFSGYPDPFPNWYHNGLEITQNNSKGFTFESYGKTLVFNVTPEHLGKYECKFQSHASAVDRVFNVKVDAAPYWHDSPPANTNTSEGETVVFDCKTSGNPAPIVTFYKNGVEMKKPRQGENWVIEGSRLTIYDVKKGINGQGDNAVYQCKAENKHGYLWTNFYLNLLAYQPKLLEEPDVAEAIEGKPFTMSCKFFASPLANVTWESPILQGLDYRTSVDQFGVGWLIFEDVKSSYEGEYKCIGTNKYGSASGTVKLLVRKPTVLEPFSEIRMEKQAGLPLKLPCEAKHDDNLDVKYEWTINGRPLAEKQIDRDNYQVLDDNTLLIINPTQADTGNYACIASTKLDSVSKIVYISIEDVPVPVYSAYISRCDSEGNSATINFEHLEPADGTVPVREFWVRYIADPEEDTGRWKTHPASIRAIDYEAVTDSERRVKASITIPLHPFGSYVFQIIARNNIGDSAPQDVKGTCNTDQKAPTRNPSGVRVEGSQPDNLIVYWDAMPREEWNGEGFSYQVQYRAKGGEWKEVVVDDPFSQKLTIDLGDRHPWEPYEVQVRARNKLGESLVAPEIVEGRTGEGDPGVTPTNFRVRDITATSATFLWDPVDPSKVQGNFTGYKITYWYDDEDVHPNEEPQVMQARRKRDARLHRRHISSSSALNRQVIIFSPTASSGTVNGLKPNSLNYAMISVLNGQNEGTPSDVISFRTKEGVPTPVRDLNAYPMNNKAPGERGIVVLKWDPPRSPNGKLTRFGVVKCKTRPNTNEVISCDKEREVPLGTTEIRLDDLEYDSDYRFNVHAYTRAGQGPPNSADTKTLPQALRLDVDPSTPELVKDDIGDDYFNVSFIPGKFDPEKQAPVGNLFHIKYRESGDSDWMTKEPKDDSLEVKVDNLDPGTRYEVAAVAVQRDKVGRIRTTESRIHEITTTGVSPKRAKLYWILVILLIILLLLVLCCFIYLLARHRGQKYPVAEKERLHGREPILPKDRAFDEYGRIDDDEKKSLTGHSRAGESETDSMAEFGEGDPGRFTEDGSFIGQYGHNKTLVVTNSDRP
ncbi:fibronectin type III domain-containing protein [Ditylenchus destructor]|uniref:Fibronectin type III domain-containing protein n=1 Tax=Ditylenchus destructor TaxID=166010 RepID=A0AAD4RCS2_9BILA|nr:fibronectin type III domain-containing protein [Ditylenchus destructor]